MNRPILLAVAAIALLVVAGFALVLVTEQPVTPAVLPPPRAQPVPAVEPAPLVPTARAPVPTPAPPAPAPPAPAPAAPPAWAVQEKLVTLEPMRREIFAALTRLDERVLTCGLSRGPVMLALQSEEGHVRVLEARVPTRDPGEVPEGVQVPPPESPEAIACVKSVLEGAVLDSPSARPGRRWDMAYSPGAMR
jgi:hypothetical protein